MVSVCTDSGIAKEQHLVAVAIGLNAYAAAVRLLFVTAHLRELPPECDVDASVRRLTLAWPTELQIQKVLLSPSNLGYSMSTV
eukprot:5162718-Amphidinium_carterae.1